jgi:phage tail sheath protein FI
MAFQLSPGVLVSEVDATTVVPSVSTSIGGLAGASVWGPANNVVLISSESQFADTFGRPDANTYGTFFTAANFLAYGSNFKFARSVGATATNAAGGGAGSASLILNKDTYEATYSSNSATYFSAKYAGALGNSLKVSMVDSNNFSTWAYNSYFDSAPGTSTAAANKNSANDEVHIVVIDEDGAFSSAANTVLERFAYASKAADIKNPDGTSNYYKDVINTKSRYIWWRGHPMGSNLVSGTSTNWGNNITGAVTFQNLSGNLTASLAGGIDDTPTAANISATYDLFTNSDSEEVSFLMSGQTTGSTIPNKLIALAETRKDCIVFASPQQNDVVNNYNGELTSVTATVASYTKSSYAFIDSGYKYQFDKYNNVYRWVPLNGDIAGLCARTDADRDPWFSPAGSTRGVIKNVVKLAWNPTASQRDTLYKNSINPVVTFSGEGTILYGDKTLQTGKSSAFDRINVRRLFIILEQSISRAARSSLFEFNDEFTRAAFVNLVEPYLREVKGRRGIYDYRVICDTTNNTSAIIDNNQFVGDIYIKPARSINFIQLNFVAVGTGVAFDEIVGRF